MTKTFALAALLSLTLAHGQTAFEVASVKPCKPGTPEPPGEHAGMAQFVYPGGRFQATATTIKFLIEWAYEIQPFEHSPGPSWLETERYDIVAKAEGGPTEEQMRLMVRTLLADRFQLKFHYEKKDLPAYVVSLKNGRTKFVPSKDEDTHFLRLTHPADSVYRVIGTRFSMKQLTDTFARRLGRVIVDNTGLTGDFNFTLDLVPDESRPSPVDPSLLIAAMQQQLGLDLKAQHATLDFLVIESAEYKKGD